MKNAGIVLAICLSFVAQAQTGLEGWREKRTRGFYDRTSPFYGDPYYDPARGTPFSPFSDPYYNPLRGTPYMGDPYYDPYAPGARQPDLGLPPGVRFRYQYKRP